ncbi:hypothetical protein [Dactylosporangium sp. NPDC006015]|uniref:hypothetical protein n=1 Tax=Dactylosporangium sp. NPDC006015 TaxID=3154576 RepID=UPI0033A28210
MARAAVVMLGTAGLVVVGAGAAQAASAEFQACTNAGGQPVSLARGWITQCTLGKGTHTYTAPPGARTVTFDLYGAQGGNPDGGVPGSGGAVRGTLPTSGDTFQINVGGQDGSSGPFVAYQRVVHEAGSAGVHMEDGPQPFAGGASSVGPTTGSGGGATVLFAAGAPLTQPLLVAGGGGGAGNHGLIFTARTGSNEWSLFPYGANGGNGGLATTNGQSGGNLTQCGPAGRCQTLVPGGGGGYGGSAGGGGGTCAANCSTAPAGRDVGLGQGGEGGSGGWGNGGGGGGGYIGGGAGGSSMNHSSYGVSGTGGGGGGTSWASPTVTNVSYRDGVRTGDGAAVITTTNANFGKYNANGFAFGAGEVFISGAAYTTDNFALIMQTDGNLAIYNRDGGVVWSSGTNGWPGALAQLQTGGNFVIWPYLNAVNPSWTTGTSSTGNQLRFSPNGTLTVTNAAGTQIWTTTNVFTAGMTLQPGTQYYAQNGYYTLLMQSDGNLVEYNRFGQPLWASNTAGYPGATATMQGDGNFVIYQAGRPLWATGTNGRGGTMFAFQGDGNLVVYTAAGAAIWASNTAGR